MIKGSTSKPEEPPVTKGGVDLATLSVAKGWLTLQKYSLTKGTRILVTATGLIVALLIGATIAYLSVGWMRDSASLNESQAVVVTQQSQISQLNKNYSELYSEFVGITQDTPKAPAPNNADIAATVECPRGTVLKNMTVTTVADGTQTFMACQVSRR